MSIAFVLPNGTSIIVTGVDDENINTAAIAAATNQLNTLFQRSGLHFSTASTQLHSMPEKVYALSPEDLTVLFHHARVLVSSKNVQCDFSALCGVLWGHVKEGENKVDSYLQKSDDKAAHRLLPTLFVLMQLFYTLRHIEEPFARQEVNSAVTIVQKDVEMAVRLGMKISSLLDSALKGSQGRAATFLQGAEACFAMIVLYVATVIRRKTINVNPVLTFLNAEVSWQLSGIGFLAMECYCEAIRRLVYSIFSRESDFANVERVATQLLVDRITKRPLFDWETFKHLHRPAFGLVTPQYAVLRCMSIVQRCVESLLLSNEPWVALLKRETIQELRKLNEKRMMLSFFQVPLLAALQGMPDVDLLDDAQLERRAVATRLSTNDCILRPNFLRILLAHGYTVRNVDHNALSPASALSLLRAFNDEVFQVPLIRLRDTEKINEKLLQSPLLTPRIFSLIVGVASENAEAARDILGEIRQVTQVIYDSSNSQRTSSLPSEKVATRLQHISLLTAGFLFMFFESNSSLIGADLCVALEALVRIFAVQALYFSGAGDAKVVDAGVAARVLQRIIMRLVYLAQMLTASQINTIFNNVVVPFSSVEEMRRNSRQHYALLEGYVRSFSSPGVALMLEEKTMLRYWVDISIRCVTNTLSGALAVAGLNFLSAAFLSKRPIAPLFVPTYVSLFIPISTRSRYGEPSLLLVRRFSRTVRASCQALEKCDEKALVTALHASDSSLRLFLSEVYGEGRFCPSLDNIQPISSVLLIVSALFDKVCILLGYTTIIAVRQDRIARFQAYFSALINLLQCHSTTVLHRVCASVEAVILEHLRGVPRMQAQWMKHIASIVDSIDGICKTVVAEWFLMLNERTKNVMVQAKL